MGNPSDGKGLTTKLIIIILIIIIIIIIIIEIQTRNIKQKGICDVFVLKGTAK